MKSLYPGFIMNKNANLNKPISASWFAIPVILVTASLAFGLLASQNGYYWDDVAFAWIWSHYGLEGLKQLFGVTRPLRAYSDFMIYSVLGTSLMAWQVLSILMRSFSAISVWWTFRQLWPRQQRPALIAALLFLIYPGFRQQPLAATYYYYWFSSGLFFLSLGLMIRAVSSKRRKWIWLISGVILSVLHLFSMEYLVGLELVRPLLLILALRRYHKDEPGNAARFVQYYLLYFAGLSIYLIWRFLFFSDGIYSPILLTNPSILNFIKLIPEVLLAIWKAGVVAWAQTLTLNFTAQDGLFYKLFLGAIYVFSFSFLYLLYRRYGSPEEQATESNAKTEWLLVGLFSLLVSGLPLYIAGLTLDLEFPGNRFTLPFMFGVSLTLTGILHFIKKQTVRIICIALLTTLAIGLHVHTANLFAQESNNVRRFIWQLAWRAPNLQPNTAILMDNYDSFPFNDDEALSFWIDWTYSPPVQSGPIPYALFMMSARVPRHAPDPAADIPSLSPGTTIKHQYFATTFEGTTDSALVVHYRPDACLHILSPEDVTALAIYQDPLQPWRRESARVILMPDLTYQALPLSNISRIITEPSVPASPPVSLLGEEPSHDWCYYYERAELARQQGDWPLIARLGDEALLNYRPADLMEYLPFIEANLRLGRWAEVKQMAGTLAQFSPASEPALCHIWNQALGDANPDEIESIRQTARDIGICVSLP